MCSETLSELQQQSVLEVAAKLSASHLPPRQDLGCCSEECCTDVVVRTGLAILMDFSDQGAWRTKWFMHGHQTEVVFLNRVYALIHIAGTAG